MADSTPKWSQGRSGFGVYELLLSWWQHRVSFLISLAITVSGLALYFFTFFGESPTPIFNFLQRLEYSSLDTRFRYRSPASTPIDPRIVMSASAACLWGTVTFAPGRLSTITGWPHICDKPSA